MVSFTGGDLHRRSLPAVARAAGDRARPPRHRARADRASTPTCSGTGCPSPTGRTSRRSPTPPATRPTATPRCSPRRRAPSTSSGDGRLRVEHAVHGRGPAPALPGAGPAVVRAGQGAVVDREVDRGDRATASSTGSSTTARAELNVDFCAAIPVLTITGSFGIAVAQALDVREHLRDPAAIAEIVAPIVEARRERPAGRPASACSRRPRSPTRTAPTGSPTPRSTPSPTCCSRPARARPGSRWASRSPRCCGGPSCSTRCAPIATCSRRAIEESVRWEPTDPMFSRWVVEDTELHGVEIPKGSVLHLCLGAANRDPDRWERPDEYDLRRPLQAGDGLRRRPPHLPRHARRPGRDDRRHQRPARPAARTCASTPTPPPPELIGFYERGVTEIPVVFG